jgi:probable HAF family extracellular repeat protein
MQTRRAPILAVVPILPLLVVFLLARRERQTYALQELSAPGCRDTMALALNNRQQVVGWCATERVPLQAVLWQHGVATKLRLLGGVRSHATGINNVGQVVGAADTRADAVSHASLSHAFLWQRGRTRDLGTLGGGQSGANAINGQGQVVGWAETTQGRHHASLWQKGRICDLGTLGGERSEATALNNRGQVVGWAETVQGRRHAFLWQNGRIYDLGTLGGECSEATAINDRGEIVGSADTTTLTRHAFRYADGVMGDMDARKESCDESSAHGINGRGQVVGLCSGLQVDGNRGADAAFCLCGDRLELLRHLLPQAQGYLLKSADSINDRGEIAANAVSGMRSHALLLTPR